MLGKTPLGWRDVLCPLINQPHIGYLLGINSGLIINPCIMDIYWRPYPLLKDSFGDMKQLGGPPSQGPLAFSL